MTSIILPSTITTIDDEAFGYCSKLELVDSEIESPFAISENVFHGISLNAVLIVPQGTRDGYVALSGWSTPFKQYLVNYTFNRLKINELH